MSKIMECGASDRLRSHLERFDLYEALQSAYRSNHSVETTLLRVMNDLLCAFNAQNYVLLVLLDLSAAFDTVKHDILNERFKTIVNVDGVAL